MSLLLGRAILFLLLWIPTFSDQVCYLIIPLFNLWSDPPMDFFSLSSKYALVTLIFYMVIFFSFPLLHTQTSWKSCTQSLFVLIQHLVTHQPPPTGFLPYFSIKTIFTKVSSDLLAAKSYAYSSVFILCSLPVDFNKINPLFFPRETIFLVSKLPCSFDFFSPPLWLYFCLFAKLSSLTWPLNVETAQVQP